MTAAEPPDNEQSAADDGYNLAARVHGEGDPSAQQADGDGVASDQYNLAHRVYGNGDVATDGRAPAVAVEPDNLAARVYGGATATLAAPASAAPAVEGAPEDGGGRFRTFESLKIPGYRWYFIAQWGTWGAMNMQMVVNSYLVFMLTGSYAALGVTALTRSVPGIVLSMVGGALADRLPKKYLVQAGQIINLMVTLSVGLLLYFDMLRFEHLLVSSFIQGSSMSLMLPARMAMLPDLVGLGRLQNATALGMGVMNIMRMVGPALGGLMLAAGAAEYTYFLMASLYLYSVVMYVKVPLTNIREGTSEAQPAVRAPPGVGARGMGRGAPRGGVGLGDIAEGFRYVFRTPIIAMLLAVNLSMVLFSMPYQMLLAGWVVDVLGQGPDTFGTLMSIAAVGSLSATVIVASIPSRHRGKLLLLGGLIMGLGLIGFSFSTTVLITAPIMVVISLGQTFRMSFSNVLIQTYVDDAYRGRVMSLNMMEMNLVSFATFFAGVLASIIGPELTLGGMAGIMVVLTLALYAFVPRLRNLD